MQYNWSKYNLLDRLDELERLKKSAKRKERIIINQNIDFLKDNIDELNNNVRDDLSYLERLLTSSLYFSNHSFLIDDIKNFSLYLMDLKAQDFEYNKISMNRKELLQITHDFYKSQDKDIYKKFMESYKYRSNHLRFENQADYSGVTYPIPYYNEDFIEIINEPTIEMLYTIIHEYAHSIAFHFNQYRCMDYNSYFFQEIESTFFELVASDYLKEKINVGSEYECIYTSLLNILKDSGDLTDYISLIDLYTKQNIIDNKHLRKLAYEQCDFTSFYFECLMDIDPIDLTTYVISYIFAVELYETYKYDKEKALYIFKKMTLLSDLTSLEYYKEIKKLGLYPNSHLTDFISDLKDKTLSR